MDGDIGPISAVRPGLDRRDGNRRTVPGVERGMKASFLLVASVLALAPSCATSRTDEVIVEYPVTGVVTAGPTCPVQPDPPDPACADRPVDGAQLWFRGTDGEVYSEIVADGDGRFQVRLPAGSYVLEPQPVDGLMGTAQPIELDVGPDAPVDVLIRYDTGIR